ncbi:MAG: hypothetical protein OHK0046_38860 [Anaerolineae bacterium]
MAWSPDGEQIALGTSGGLWLYDTDDLSHYQLLSAREPLDVHRIAFSHDGQYVAANSVHTILEPECLAPRCRYQGALYVWNRMSGKLLGKWVHGYYYSGLVTPHFTDSGRLLLAIPSLRLYEVDLADFLPTLLYQIEVPLSQPRHITFSGDGKRLFIGGGRLSGSRETFNPPPSSYHSYVYDSQTGVLISELATESVVYDGQFDHDGSTIITSSNSGLQVWDVATATIEQGIQSLGHVAISEDDQTIAHVNCDDIRMCDLVVDLANGDTVTHEILYRHPNYLTLQGLTVRFNDDSTRVAVTLSRQMFIFNL